MTDSAESRTRRSTSQTSRTHAARDYARRQLGIPKPRSTHWTDKAACAGKFTEDWFSDWGERKAKKVCAGCPVRNECLAAYLFEPHGIFGGLTPTERESYRRNIRRKTGQP
jgi:WhiB family redox-sensing transcriptional regulator